MTTTLYNAQTIARLGDCDWHINQAAAEGRVLRNECPTWRENALERAGELFLAGKWDESRRQARQFEEA